MSLDFTLTGIKDYETLCWKTKSNGVEMDPITQSLILWTLSAGINEITDANAPEFYARIKLMGATATTAADVKRHIGLKTNASNQTRAAWLKNHMTNVLNDYVREYGRKVDAS